jgi:hypothetical protein
MTPKGIPVRPPRLGESRQRMLGTDPTTVARSGKQMLWSHDRWKPAYTENFGNFCRFFFVSQGITSKRIHQGKNLTASFVAPGT